MKNMIFTKKHIVLASLILILAVAVYLNWMFANQNNDIVDSALNLNGGNVDGANYGEAQQVDKTVTASVYFEEARLNRSVARDQSLSTIEGLLNNQDVTSDDKAAAVAQATTIATDIEAESRIENLIKAKGFADCIAYINGESCNIIVQTEGLLASEAAQIKDIVLKESKVEAKNISIVEVN